MQNDEVELVRYHSRELVRELGFIQLRSKKANLHASQVHALIEFSRHGSLSNDKLAQLLRLDKSSVSRLISQLKKSNLLEEIFDPNDKRRKLIKLTSDGQVLAEEVHLTANTLVTGALSHLSEENRQCVIQGLELYAQALKKARLLKDVTIRKIEKSDNQPLCAVIKEVLTDFGLNKPGFAYYDPELLTMYQAYQKPKALYLVVEWNGRLIGGGGIVPLQGAHANVCELTKMYLSSDARGKGIGAELLSRLMTQAHEMGYAHCYLETTDNLTQAIRLYKKFGFEPLDHPMGETGHFSCQHWYLKTF